MAEPAKVIEFLQHVATAPRCSQCHTRMELRRVDPSWFISTADTFTLYQCATCGLQDRLEGRTDTEEPRA
jgi:DNA-directed RNA polymerase subunit RPC12/RpoP